MGTRRVIAWSRQDGAVRLRTTKESLPSSGHEDALVRMAFAVLDPEALHAAGPGGVPQVAFVGVVRRRGQDGPPPGTVVTGVGSLADVVCVPASALVPVRAGPARPTMALFPILWPILTALAELRLVPGEQVLISGMGFVSRLTEQLVTVYGGRLLRTAVEGDQRQRTSAHGHELREADVLIDTTADPGRWAKMLLLVRRLGRVLLLLPPGPQTHPFDFYSRVHRASLTVLSRRVPALSMRTPAMSGDDLAERVLDRVGPRMDGYLLGVRVGGGLSAEAMPDLAVLSHGQGLLFSFEERPGEG